MRKSCFYDMLHLPLHAGSKYIEYSPLDAPQDDITYNHYYSHEQPTPYSSK